MRRIAVTALVGAVVFGLSLSAPPAQAVPTDLPPQRYTITLEEHSDCIAPNNCTNWVTATGGGLLDLTPLSLLASNGITTTGISPAGGTIIIGPPGQDLVYLFSGPITGPTSFGSGAGARADQGSGDTVGIVSGGGSTHLLVVPVGSPLSGQVDFSNTSEFDTLGTFSSLGVTLGTYVWSWGSDPGDSVTLVIGGSSAAPIPEPASAMLLGAALAALLLAGTIRRARRAA